MLCQPDSMICWLLSGRYKYAKIISKLSLSSLDVLPHVMFKAQPTTELSKFINAYKSASSRLIKKEFPFIKSQLWKEYFWSRSFCLLTSGGAPIEVLRQYIESQGSKSGIAHYRWWWYRCHHRVGVPYHTTPNIPQHFSEAYEHWAYLKAL